MIKKVVLSFPVDATDRSLTYDLVKLYDIRINILKAEIQAGKSGNLLVELEADTDKLDQGIAYLIENGVTVSPVSSKVSYDASLCIDCRKHFRQDRWSYFTIAYKETDLCIGVDRGSWQPEIPVCAERFVRELRTDMDRWIGSHPDYAQALTPFQASGDAPGIFKEMSRVTQTSGIGPMSAVAGAVALKVGENLKKRFGIKEVIVENGGDIYADLCQDMDISVFAGSSPLSEKVGLHIEAAYAPLGICTSSGTVGPSLSFGKADAVMIVCSDVMLADTYATAFANTIQTAEDVQTCIEKIREQEDILAAIAIKDDKLGICGNFELKLF